MKIITLGNGFIANHLPYEKITTRLDANIYHIDRLLAVQNPDVVVNCIGRTGRPNIDWCEKHQEETVLANTALPILLAEACSRRNIHFVHIGSGCIYFGSSPRKKIRQNEHGNYEWIEPGWKETDFANPQSFYSKTKYAADLAIGDLPNTTILRIRMPLSDKNDPRNLINKLRGYNQVINIPNSMTFIDDLVRCVDHVIQQELTGIYHVVNPEPLTATQIMRAYQQYQFNHIFEVIEEEQLNKLTIAKRSNCILNTDKLNQVGFIMTSSKEALDKCMANYMKNMEK
jgi:3,5-epimerase/4-reductase